MDVPDDILAVLRCSSCNMVLSQGPILQQHDGTTVCGRCVKPNQPTSRNSMYEAAAALLRFPCRNRDLGCQDTVAFAAEQEEITHEMSCTYRQYLCPVVSAGRCDWLGRRGDLVAHCRAQHPGQVLQNTSQLVHDISSSSLNTYLLTAFRTLFLLHIKVCVVTARIFHAVHYMGDPNKVNKFIFTVDVKRGKQLITKSKSVAPPGCLAIQEDSSMIMHINSLLQMLDGFQGSTFTVTVWDTTGCSKCHAELSKYNYFDDDTNGWLCEHCAPTKRICINSSKGCTYTDIDVKCVNHESFVCPYIMECPVCEKSIENTLTTHYSIAHNSITYESGALWENDGYSGRVYFISTEVGLIRCRCWPLGDTFQLNLTTPLHSEQLYELYCEIQIVEPITKKSKTYIPETLYSDRKDWYIIVHKSEFPSYNGQFCICVTIKRVDSEY